MIEPTLYPSNGSADPVLGLDVRDGQIVGVDDKGEVAATGDNLKGRWFRLVRRYHGTPETRGKIRIVDVGHVPLMAQRGEAELAAGYELRYEPESGSSGAVELCRRAEPLWPNAVVNLAEEAGKRIWDVPQTLVEKAKAAARRKATEELRRIRKLPRKVIETIRREIPLDRRLKVIFVLKDEAYDESTGTISPTPGTITLACPGAALSDMKLMGYDPQDQEHPTTLPQRQAVIKMLTGRYCDAFTFTVDGRSLYWMNRSQWFSWHPAGTVEALWNENGAICLKRPRYAIYTHEEVVSHCKQLPPCSDSVSWEDIPQGAELISVTPGSPAR